MILGTWAEVLNLLNVAMLVFGMSALAQLLLLPVLRQGCQRLAAAEQKWLILGWAVMPLLNSAGVWLLLLTAPDSSWLHWHHSDWFFIDSWHGGLLLLAGGWLLWSLTRAVRSAFRGRSEIRLLTSLATPANDSRVAGVLATDDVIALTVGLWRPQVFVSQGFLERVDLSQQAVVLAHEQAHVRRRDPLMRWLLACLCSHLPWRLTAGLRQQFHLATEQLADQAAVRTAPATDIAATLVAVARLQRQRMPSGHTGFSAGFVRRQELPQRVDALLHPMPTHGLRFVYAALVLAVLMVAVMLMLDPLHHQLDFLLAH